MNAFTYGLNLDVDHKPVSATGAVTYTYGIVMDVAGNTEGTSRAYGINISGVSGADLNYAIWDGSGADWILDGDSQKIYRRPQRIFLTQYLRAQSSPSSYWKILGGLSAMSVALSMLELSALRVIKQRLLRLRRLQ